MMPKNLSLASGSPQPRGKQYFQHSYPTGLSSTRRSPPAPPRHLPAPAHFHAAIKAIFLKYFLISPLLCLNKAVWRHLLYLLPSFVLLLVIEVAVHPPRGEPATGPGQPEHHTPQATATGSGMGELPKPRQSQPQS